MNFFSSDEYLGALAETWYPGRRAQPRLFAAGDRLFRLLAVEGRPVVTDGIGAGAYHFLDFFEPLGHAPDQAAAVGVVRWLPRVALDAHPCSSAPGGAAPTPSDLSPAPYVDWSVFRDWTAFEEHYVGRRGSLARDSRRKRRNLEARFGPLRLTWDDRRPEVFETVLAWKSAQYRRSALRDGFAIHQNVTLFRELWRRGLLVVSSLAAGDRIVAAHFGARWRRRFFSWVPAYDREVLEQSPGRLLLEDLLRASHANGDEEFDFLVGDEPYKYHYATHQRMVGPVGTPPLPESVRKAARTAVKKALSLCPPLLQRARALEHAWAAAAGRRA
jgi:hypothetical protein